jgi:hypothetical protein
MPFSRRSVPFDTVLIGELLLGALLLAPAGPAWAGNDDEEDGRLGAREVLENIHDDAKHRRKFFYGDEDSRDPVWARGRRGGDRYGNFDDPEKARRLVAEEILDGLEQRLNQRRWIPFRDRDRKRSGPEILFGLDDPTPAPPVIASDAWHSRFRLNLMRGLEYRQEWPTGERNRKLQMRVFGPVVPGGPGLGLQLKGHVLDRRYRLNAYGGSNEVGMTMDLEF